MKKIELRQPGIAEIPMLPAVLHDDTGDYPSEEVLEFIKKFDCAKYGCLALAEFIKEVWWAADWGYLMKGKRVKKLYLSTGGWSGNEEIMSALQDNFLFWSMCWKQTRRGGHYIFEIRAEKIKDADDEGDGEEWEVEERRYVYEVRQDYDGNQGDLIMEEEFDTQYGSVLTVSTKIQSFKN